MSQKRGEWGRERKGGGEKGGGWLLVEVTVLKRKWVNGEREPTQVFDAKAQQHEAEHAPTDRGKTWDIINIVQIQDIALPYTHAIIIINYGPQNGANATCFAAKFSN